MTLETSNAARPNVELNAPPKNDGTNRITKQVESNMLVFYDAEGTQHKIYIPKGMFQKVLELAREEKWEGLFNFPAYNKRFTTSNKKRC
ncbi:uncharacterized protein ACLA_006560 [Aspergillus clavatus NRRL 1]|uniref:Uncharacterized protein n=1 Tax=Aspergillus clavatus (strain ATCC 1007 / CBS 513.65 / DSM 816 / NCTC 3887 / NRRL 1 / QM 1276 / 107) TaxID=344612 RepID=A1CDH2_ASPCL|nr:uncharacterized protein ACLA_006560 [Aspergillus clavatus NRRL 1]EAW11899.1 hypothetical protein ACLA_006560 [Aspergillus clavatus NRRL 1]